MTLLIEVLLTIRTLSYEKSTEPLEPQSDCTVLRTMADFHGLHGSFIFRKFSANINQNFSVPWVFSNLEPNEREKKKKKKKKKQRKKKKKTTKKKKKKAQMKNSTLTASNLHHVVGHLNEPLLLALLFFFFVSSSPPDD